MKCYVINIQTMDELFRFSPQWLPRIGEFINPTGDTGKKLRDSGAPTQWVVIEVHHTVIEDAPSAAHGVHLYCEPRGAILSQDDSQDMNICGLCGLPGADKVPHPVYWPGEQEPDTELVHEACEDEECRRAASCLSDREKEDFIRGI